MTGYLDILQGYVESPDHAGPAIRERAPFGLGVLCFLASGTSLYLANSVGRHFMPFSSGLIGLILICLSRLLAGLFMTGFLHLLAELSGGRGSSIGLFVYLGLGDLVWALALPVVLVLRLAGLSQSPFALWLMLTALGFSFIGMRAAGLRENYGVTPGLSWMLVCVPYALFALLTMFLISLAVFGAVASIIHLIS